MTRADEVRRLAEALCRLPDGVHGAPPGKWPCRECTVQAQRAIDAGARMPEPPAQRNPISRETARASLNCRCSGSVVWSVPDIDRERDRLNRIAPSIVRDLAEAAKGEDGRIKLVDEWCGSYWFRPAALVAALTRADAGGAS